MSISKITTSPSSLSSIKNLWKEFQPRLEPNLRPFLGFLAEIGSPHLTLPPVIHVAGTNGKGSSIAMLRAIYEAAGYTVHAITSPHLTCVTERLVLGAKQVDMSTFEATFKKYDQAARRHTLSWYEFIIGVCFDLCSKNSADLMLIEVGLGGEFDATNVIPAPLVSLITPISLDHEKILGPGLENIAQAKAGIIKSGSMIVAHPQLVEVKAVIKEQAKRVNATLSFSSYGVVDADVNLLGKHQQQNASVIIDVVQALQNHFPVKGISIQKGLEQVRWPGRLEQKYKSDALEIYFDVGHNEGAAKAIADHFKTVFGKKILVMQLGVAKNIEKTLKPLLSIFDLFYFIKTDGVRFHPPEVLVGFVEEQGRCAEMVINLNAFIETQKSTYNAQPEKENPVTILIAGSHEI